MRLLVAVILSVEPVLLDGNTVTAVGLVVKGPGDMGVASESRPGVKDSSNIGDIGLAGSDHVERSPALLTV